MRRSLTPDELTQVIIVKMAELRPDLDHGGPINMSLPGLAAAIALGINLGRAEVSACNTCHQPVAATEQGCIRCLQVRCTSCPSCDCFDAPLELADV